MKGGEKMTKNPMISFCVLFYNQEKYVEETLDSMLYQDYDNYEIIIRDDCSSDSTQEVIKAYLKNKNTNIQVKVEYGKENLGIVKSVNRTLSLANGKYIALQGGDDISLPTRLSESINIILEYNIDLIGVDAIIVNENKQTIHESFYVRGSNESDVAFKSDLDKKIKIKLDESIYLQNSNSEFVGYDCLGGFGIVFNRNILNYYKGFFPEDIKYEDRLLTFLAHMNNGCILYTHQLVLYRRTGSNLSMPKAINKKMMISNMNKLKLMENEVSKTELEYLSNDGYVNEKYNRKIISQMLKSEYYKNLFQLKLTSNNIIVEKKFFILMEIIKNPNTNFISKVKNILVYCFPFLYKRNIIKSYYLRLDWFGN